MIKSKIEWTDSTWNPIRGCTKVSPGCAHCYAETFAERFRGVPGHPFEHGFDLQLVPKHLGDPLKWSEPRRIFVNSMSDLFHDGVPSDYIDEVFTVMTLTPWHTYQILTKRPERMREYVTERADGTPLPNVWLGVSCEDQQRADERIPVLLQTPAARRFVSCEPLLGPVDLTVCPYNRPPYCTQCGGHEHLCSGYLGDLDWVIVGGESGPKARPMHPDWVRSMRDQCVATNVPFFFKQWGEWEVATDENGRRNGYLGSCMPNTGEKFTWLGRSGKTYNPGAPFDDDCYSMARVGKKAAGRLLDGREWNEYPSEVDA